MTKKLIMAALVAVSALASHADEGMWTLSNIDPRTAQVMKDLGLQLTPEQLYSTTSGTSLKDAVVDFGDFCSGVVVSPDGLVFTNHHCGFSSIQSLSSTTHDYLKDGFVAHNHSEELPAEGLFVRFLVSTEDITPRFKKALESNDDDAADSLCIAIEAEYRQRDSTLDYSVQPFYGGNAYYISTYKVYNDIRLVFTPTQTLGKFGGDTDNWMWPRQTCDFSVFRIYTDKNGEPADYSPENVPMKPKRYAQVSLDGYTEGSYCMTVGYPGSTDRYLSSYGIKDRMVNENEPRIEVRGLKQDIWTKWMRSDRAIAIKYASKFANSSNYWKNSIGMNKALTDLNVVADKQQKERDIEQWYKGNADLEKRFGGMFDHLSSAYTRRNKASRAGTYFSETFSGIELMRIAQQALGLATATDSAMAANYLTKLNDLYKDYDPRVDEEVMGVLLKNYAEKVDSVYQPNFMDSISVKYNGDYKAYAHDVFSHSILTKPNPVLDICTIGDGIYDDPGIEFWEDAYAMVYALYSDMAEPNDTIDYNERLLTQAILEKDQQQPHYSDANFSMRLSYGYIQDYTAGETHYDYYTNAKSIVDKIENGKDNPDYEMEPELTAMLKAGDFGRYADKNTGDMHLCFLSNNDITGGNSGSPMFNGKGELIGLAFDGNWEAMSGDILFDKSLQRCIGVDIRFVVYLIDKWGHADNLIKELGL